MWSTSTAQNHGRNIRVMAMGFHRGTLAKLQRILEGPVVEVEETALEGLGLGRGDLLLFSLKDPYHQELRRLQSLHQAFPGIGIVVYAPRSTLGREMELLASGVLEIFHRLAEAPGAMARARARTGQVAKPLGPVRDNSLEGLFPNLHDWISVISVAEDGAFIFEAVNPPLGATAGFLNPDFVGHSPLECLPPSISRPLVDHLVQAVRP